MGYDVSFTISTGIYETEVMDLGNYTYNVSPMYVDALGYSLGDLDGKMSGNVIEELSLGIEKMKQNPKKYIDMNPSNGWGDYEGALQFLVNIYEKCKNHLKCIIRIN